MKSLVISFFFLTVSICFSVNMLTLGRLAAMFGGFVLLWVVPFYFYHIQLFYRHFRLEDNQNFIYKHWKDTPS